MEQITELLKNHKSVDGITLQQHLQAIIQKYLNGDKHTDGIKNFELLSNFVKRNEFVYKDPKSDKEVNNIPVVHNDTYEWAQKCLSLFKEYNTLKKQKEQNILFPNFVNDSQMLEWTGINFGEEETVRIQMSLRKLQQQTKSIQLRFWGKILTRTNDYYVAEGLISNKYADQVPQGSEPIGEGANYYTYWVTHDVLGEWFELPFVTPEQINAAKQIKYIFEGDLNAQVKTYPAFPGQEKHFLRAQIARISAATVLVPKDLYTLNEETKQLEFGEEAYKLPEYGELKSLETWVHLYPALLNLGRCSYWVDPSLSEEKREEKLAELAEKDPEIERLRGIGEEKSPYWKEGDEEEQPNWLVREYGDQQQFNLVGKDDGNVGCYGTISFRNLTWPGSYLVCNSKGWANIYVGYGLKTNQNAFNPQSPPDIQNEGDDIEEHPEPNPNKPIEQLEPDSDKEGKEGEEDEEEA